MARTGLLVALVFVGSAISWWPGLALGLPLQIPLCGIAIYVCLSMALVPSSWLLLLAASGIGTFGGLYLGSAVWPSDDPIGAAWVPYVAAAGAFLVMFAGLFAGLILRRRFISNTTLRHAIWLLLLACLALEMVSLAFAPTLIRRRAVRNERLAAERLTALNDA